MPNRHRSRELVVQWVYQWMLNPIDLPLAKTRSRAFWEDQAEGSTENQAYFESTALGVLGRLPEIDKKIEALLTNWRMDRLEKVDLAILRVGSFEILFQDETQKADIPVIIDEAVEIAKKFGTKESPSFINGILDKVRNERKDMQNE
jgi:N utilization substance protein B